MDIRRKQKKRIVAVCFICCVFFAVSIGMCFKTCLFNKDDVSALIRQYTKSVLTIYPRGIYYDKNGIPFNNRAEKSEDQLPFVRSSESSVGSVIIGKTEIDPLSTEGDSLKGVSGLELVYNLLMSGGSPIKLVASVDASGVVLTQYGYSVENDHPNEGGSITLTLDYHMQKIFENVCEASLKEGQYKAIAAVLSDVKSGGILAAASAGSEMNHTVLSYQPGSVMKILTAGAAIENKAVKPDDIYECKGYVEIDEKKYYCSNGHAHGKINFEEAFAYSCNCYFYELGKKLIYTDENGDRRSKMLELAASCGFGVYPQAPAERFLLEYKDHFSFVPSIIYNDADIFNATMGQGSVQASPMLINQIVMSIASGNNGKSLHIIEKAYDGADNEVRLLETGEFRLDLKDETIKKLQILMRAAGSYGTAKQSKLNKSVKLAGKTGTSETIKGEECNAWFCGYFPYENPKYALTVFIEHGGSGADSALSIFDKLAANVLELESD